ncbi:MULTISPECIES: GH116 family glycosyl-hydrolase [unclassified Streptomyces]|uniref:GH116 family glycosyl-hydrolase n=1 Tax=unclassified Streptomyces TaxID=2593676 RepID=UPI002E381C26|nr:GH116 family glycosyl-hydrolase [Streptomyces sp. NBC_01261]WSX55623.1 non-lysosomal glucosylceramidase [Streptomyces sp. NBC_00986]
MSSPDNSHQDPTPEALPRRAFIRGGALSVAALVAAGELGGFQALASVPTTHASPLNAARVPEAAYVRAWGLAPDGPCEAAADPECHTGQPTGLRGLAGGMSVPGLGIPLGGVGAGSFQYNLFGTFGPWNMGGSQSSNWWEMRTLPQAAFHIREQVAGATGAPTVKTLATRHDNIAPQRDFAGVLPGWNQLAPGDGTYAALYPFGWTTYSAFQSQVSMRFWSPIVAREDERTSMPVAFFDVELANPTTKVIDLSVMFTFPNATPHDTGTTRTGFYSRFDTDARSGVAGVTLGSDHPTNTPDAYKSEWTIAALPASGQKLTYATSWDGAGDGGDIYGPFSSTGKLPNKALDNSNSAGAVTVSAQLRPGQKTTVRYALSWDFPQVYYDAAPEGRAVWMRRYTEFLGAASTASNDYVPNSYPFKQAFAIAQRELARHDDSLTAVEAWWKPIAENKKYPVWLRKAALNELFGMVFDASFWEAGLVSSTVTPAPGGPRLGAEIPGTHLFYTIDAGSGGAPANEMDVDSFGYLLYTKLFPNIELGRLRGWLQLTKQDKWGRVPQQIMFDTGPFITATGANQGAPSATSEPVFGAPPAGTDDLGALFDPAGGDAFRDCFHKLIYRVYALYQETDDKSLLAYGYPQMLRTLKHSQFFRPPGSHLPADPPSNNPANTYDQLLVNGHGIYNCQLYLLSLQILSTLTPTARTLGIPEATASVQKEIDTELAAAKAEFERIFWNPGTGRYRFSDGTGGIDGRTGNIFGIKKPVLPTDAVFLDAFYAQGIASQLGLPNLINLQRARTHWHNTLDAFLAPKDSDGIPTGPPIILDENLKHYPMDYIQPPGGFVPEIADVWPGTTWMATAAAVHIGRATGDRKLITKALKMSEAVANRIYDDGATTKGHAFATPESWFVDDVNISRYAAYARARSVWQLVDALDPIPRSPKSSRPGQD